MKSWFSNDWIARLNAHNNAGVFFRAAVLSVDDTTTLYFADIDEAITYDGHVYTPMPMVWQGVGQNSQQNLPTITVTVSNITGEVGAFLETTNLLGRDVVLHLLHRDLLSTITDTDSARLQVLAVEWTWERATLHLGLNLALQEVLPRN